MKPQSLTNSAKAVAIVRIGIVAVFCSTTTMYAARAIITSVTPDLTTHVLTINGADLANTTPRVQLGGINLTLISYTQTTIQATLPNFAPGSYQLIVTVRINNTNTAVFFEVGIPAGDGGVPHGMKEFTASGSWPVPEGVTRILVEVWGAGGGAGAFEGCAPGGYGGAGAYSRTVFSVTQGQNVTITSGQGGGVGAPGGPSSVTVGTSQLTSGGGAPGERGGRPPECLGGANGSPGTPDPNASIGRASASGAICPARADGYNARPPSSMPASGTIEPAGAFGGGPKDAADGGGCGPASGGNGYVLIQW